MKEVLEVIKNNKIKITIIILIILMISVSIVLYINYAKKHYEVKEVSVFNYFLVKEEGNYGVIDKSGNIIIDPNYENIIIPNPELDIFICRTLEKNIILNKDKNEILNDYEEILPIQIKGIISNMPYEKTVLKYKKDNKYGLINFEGKEITKPLYDEINGLENKESEMLVKKDDKYGVINSKGAVIIDNNYDSIKADGFYTNEDKYKLSGYVVSKKTQDGYRYGYINSNGKKELDIEYNSIERVIEANDVKDVYLVASKNGKYGLVKNKKIIINYSYQNIEYDETNRIFVLQRTTKYGIATREGKEIIPIAYDQININGIYIQAIKDEKVTYFNYLGEKISNTEYTSMIQINDGRYYITINEHGLYGIKNKDNKLVDNKYKYIEYLYYDYFIASNDEGLLGIIDSKDTIIVEFKYDVLQQINESEVVEGKILKENISHIYSKQMNKIADGKMSINIAKEYIQICMSDKIIYINYEGKEISNKELFSENKLFAVNIDGKWGFEDRQGNIVVEAKYDVVTNFESSVYAGIKLSDKWGVINQEGQVIIEPTYVLDTTNIKPEFLNKYYKIYYGYGESYYTNEI